MLRQCHLVLPSASTPCDSRSSTQTIRQHSLVDSCLHQWHIVALLDMLRQCHLVMPSASTPCDSRSSTQTIRQHSLLCTHAYQYNFADLGWHADQVRMQCTNGHRENRSRSSTEYRIAKSSCTSSSNRVKHCTETPHSQMLARRKRMRNRQLTE